MESSIYGTNPEGANPTGAQPMGATIQGNSFAPIPVEVGPKKSPKTPMIIAGVFAALAVISLIIASVFGAQVEEIWTDIDSEKYTTEMGTSADIVYDDEDGQGEVGWGIFIDGDYNDNDENGKVDACETFVLKVMNNGTDVTDNVFRYNCVYESNNSATWLGMDGKIEIGTVCSTLDESHSCKIGETYTISNNDSKTMVLFDYDELFGPLLEDSIGLGLMAAVSGGAGCCSICVGVIALVIGLTRLGGGKQPQVAYQMQ
ncbi:MAG: hypothetical protein CMA65_01435 [Euryarchaeota archaeon]|nr:hypothetical protein [Euryarchaeota archaeon]